MTDRRARRIRSVGIWVLLAGVATVVAVSAFPAVSRAVPTAFQPAILAHADAHELRLVPTSGSLTPGASGTGEFGLAGGVLSGTFHVRSLPAQGIHLAYVAWFVNTATGDKAFLGPIQEDGAHTILFQTAGNGVVSFAASVFTNGTDAGKAIQLAPTGQNLFIVLVENAINFADPSPVSTSVFAMF